MTIIIAVVMLSLIIFVHEFGHFITAKLFKMPVSEFSIGMGPQVFGVETEETEYSIRTIPMGGFVNIEGMEIGSDVKNGFNTKPAYQRFIVLFAGVFMNFITALLVLIITVKLVGTYEYNLKPIIGTVSESSINKDILKNNDEIVSIDGIKIEKWEDIAQTVKKIEIKKDIPVVVLRDGNKENIKVNLMKEDKSNRYLLGISPKIEKKNLSLTQSIEYGWESFKNILFDTLRGFGLLVGGNVNIRDISGPVGILQIVGQVSKLGVVSLASLWAILSINVGILNLLPIPALDGGRIIFVILEYFGIKLNKKLEEKLHKGGMVILLFFIVLISVNDIFKIIK